MASRLTATTSFPRVFSQLLQYLTQRLSFLAHRAAPMSKTDLTFRGFSLKFVDFTAQFCFRCKFSFHEERRSGCSSGVEPGLTVASFSWTNHNSLLRVATNELASFCIDHRFRQMASFLVRQSEQRRDKSPLSRMLKYFEIKKALALVVCFIIQLKTPRNGL